jgi:hypothetical protein
MRRFRAVAMLAFFLILTSVFFADDAGVRSSESFNASWRFARFGPMADRSTRPEPGAERWSIVASASSEEAAKGNVAENAFDGDQAPLWCALVPRSHNLVQVEIEAPGEIVTVGNGNATSHEPFQAKQRSAYNGLCQVIAKGCLGQPGPITLKAKSNGLKDAAISFSNK